MMPLSEFPADHRAAIEALAAAPEPPPRWLSVGGGLAMIPSRAFIEWHLRRGRDITRQWTRRPLPKGLRDAVFARDGGICRLCNEPIGTEPWHIDHIKPVKYGGSNGPGNLQLAHATCNARKGARWSE